MAYLAASHMINYTIPCEQRLLLRVIALPPVYTIYSLISTILYPTDVYLAESPNMVEASELAAVFKLYVYYLTPGATVLQRDQYFEDLERTHIKIPMVCCSLERNTARKHEQRSLRWFRIILPLLSLSSLLALSERN